ncbi:MAG: trypsin-like peptidase domain-containing protein, partial [Bacteroidota bacterium]|nr:trypsin-like peptidase domain-containing protein [Bacteroidota bacterium]
MNKTEKLKILLIAFVLGISGGIIGYWIMPTNTTTISNENENAQIAQNVQFASMNPLAGIPDFTVAAEKGTEAVVHIKTEYYDQGEDPVYNFFFGRPGDNAPAQGSGSGVIISTDGYIVTNNHVIDKSTNIIVTMENKTEYKAKIIGRDPSTDLALIKIDAENLNTLTFGNSDDLKIGEWVLAIGNPFNLTSTVTAGIVSAKARSINILNKRYAIESFIQTDAAVNPGNSGGALITTDGKLIGINTAISSPTGSFAGYSFAIPVSIVQKVVKDIIEFGEVQRAFIGAKI